MAKKAYFQHEKEPSKIEQISEHKLHTEQIHRDKDRNHAALQFFCSEDVFTPKAVS